MKYKVYKNHENFFRVKIEDPILGERFLVDTDLMIAIVGSHKSKPLNFLSEESAHQGFRDFLKHVETIKAFLRKRRKLK